MWDTSYTPKKKMDVSLITDVLLLLESLHELTSIRLMIQLDCFFAFPSKSGKG